MPDRLLALRGTIETAGTACHHLARWAQHVGPAHGTAGRHLDRYRIGWPAFEQDAHDLGNHVARTSDDDGIAGSDILTENLVHVVQGGVGHRDTADLYGLQPGNRGHGAGTSDLELDRLDERQLLPGGELACDGPTRMMAGRTQADLIGDPVDLEDHAVDLVGQRVAAATQVVEIGTTAVRSLDLMQLLRYRDAPAGEPLQHRVLTLARVERERAPSIAAETQGTRGCDAWIELTQAPSRRIAWIGEGALAPLGGISVESREPLACHIDLAAHLEHRGPVLADQAQRHALDGAHVRGDILAGRAVAAGRGLHQRTCLVADAHSQPVELGLGGVEDRIGTRQGGGDATVELDQLPIAHGVGERDHGQTVANRSNGGERRGTDPLGRRIRRLQVRVGGFEGLKLGEESIVFGVRDLRIVEDVIADIMAGDLRAQPFGALGGGIRADQRSAVRAHRRSLSSTAWRRSSSFLTVSGRRVSSSTSPSSSLASLRAVAIISSRMVMSSGRPSSWAKSIRPGVEKSSIPSNGKVPGLTMLAMLK